MFVHSTHQQTHHRAEAACKPMSKVAPLTCIRLQTKFAFPSYSSTAIHVSKHAPSCIFCCYGLLVFDRNFPSHCASCSAKANHFTGKQTLPDKKKFTRATFKITHGWFCRQHPLGTGDCSMGTRQGPVPAPRLGRDCKATPNGMGLQAACWLCITIATKLSSCDCMKPEELSNACMSMSRSQELTPPHGIGP